MGQNLQAVEEWVQVATDQSVVGSEIGTDKFTLLASSAQVGEACMELDWKLKITGASTDDVIVGFVRGDGVSGDEVSTLSEAVATVECGGESAPFYHYGRLAHGAIGSGGMFTLKRSGSEAGIKADMWIRRYRYV